MSKTLKIKPVGGFILVKPAKEEEKTSSGLIIQSTSKGEKPQKGEIISLGTGRLDKDGNKLAWNVKEGDTILFKKYSPEEIEFDGTEYLIMREEDILAVLN